MQVGRVSSRQPRLVGTRFSSTCLSRHALPAADTSTGPRSGKSDWETRAVRQKNWTVDKPSLLVRRQSFPAVTRHKGPASTEMRKPYRFYSLNRPVRAPYLIAKLLLHGIFANSVFFSTSPLLRTETATVMEQVQSVQSVPQWRTRAPNPRHPDILPAEMGCQVENESLSRRTHSREEVGAPLLPSTPLCC